MAEDHDELVGFDVRLEQRAGQLFVAELQLALIRVIRESSAVFSLARVGERGIQLESPFADLLNELLVTVEALSFRCAEKC